MLLDWSAVPLFVLASLGMAVVPGPAVLYIVARGMDQGRFAGMVSALGIAVGGMVHVVASAFGLAALLAASAEAFTVVKLAGAAYLIWLGIHKLFLEKATGAAEQAAVVEPQPLARVFAQGVVVNVLNPKTALFFLAFLPQFADPARGAFALQIVLLGVIHNVVALTSDTAYALLAGTFGAWLRRHRGFLRSQRYVSGSIYLALGVVTAVTGSDAS